MAVLGKRVLLVLLGVLLMLIVLANPGCQFAYPYELRGVVRNAKDGAPLEEVTVSFKAEGLFSGPADSLVATDSRGQFTFRFDVSDGEFEGTELPRWTLVLSKDGRHERLDVSPLERPTSPKTRTHVLVFAYMKIDE